MKYLCCIALLLASYAQAGELLPMSGEESDEMREALDEVLPEAVANLPAGITVEPVLEQIKYSNGFKRIMLGPLVGTSYVVLRIKITDQAGKVTEEVFSNEAGAWRGTFKPRIDSDMVTEVADQANQFIAGYALSLANGL